MNPVGWLGISVATGAKIVSWIGLAVHVVIFTHVLTAFGALTDMKYRLEKEKNRNRTSHFIFRQVAGRDINYFADSFTDDFSEYLDKTNKEVLEATLYMTLTFVLDIILHVGIETSHRGLCYTFIILSFLIFVFQILVYPACPVISDILFLYKTWIIYAFAQTI